MPRRFHAPYSVASSGVSAASSVRTVAPMPASSCWSPPFAIASGPADVPLGENGCLASATRNLPPTEAITIRMAGGVSLTRGGSWRRLVDDQPLAQGHHGRLVVAEALVEPERHAVVVAGHQVGLWESERLQPAAVLRPD